MVVLNTADHSDPCKQKINKTLFMEKTPTLVETDATSLGGQNLNGWVPGA